jgi:PAS domain S-box-containing protein
MKPRIQFGLPLTLGIIVLTIEALVLFLLGNHYLRRFSEEVNRRLQEAIARPGILVAQGALSTDAFGQRDTLENLVGPALDDALMVTANGVILVALHPEHVGRRWPEVMPDSPDWLKRAATGGFTQNLDEGTNSYLIRVAPVAIAAGQAPALFDYVRLRTTESERELASLRWFIVGGSVAAFLATTAALLVAAHLLVTRRLKRITAAVARVASGQYDTRVEEDRLKDEIAYLANGFNVMIAELRTSFQRQHEAVATAEAAEESYRTLIENAGEAIFVAQEGRFVFANPQCCRMFDCTLDDALSATVTHFVHPDDRPLVAQRHAQRLRGESPPNRYEFRLLSAKGRLIWGDLNVVLIRWHGKPASLNFLSDITERKQAETDREHLQAQLLQSQKMESVGRLAGGVAHDFNNMLQAILGNVELALLESPADSPVRNSLLEIRQSATRSAKLTAQLLAFARRQTAAPRVIDLNDSIAESFAMLRRLIGEHIALTFHPAAGLWPVQIDPVQMDQVLTNLCINSSDAIQGNGAVTITTANVVLETVSPPHPPEFTPGHYVLLAVADDGCGMNGETRGHLFEPFFTTKPPGRGTGLGLATVFGIVKQNGGFIEVESAVGQGTTVKIYLPRTTEVAARSTEAAPEPSVLGNETILLVEDEAQVLHLGSRILTRHGYKVLPAGAPQQALELASTADGRIDLLITDVVMPGMNGRELQRQLQTQFPRLKCLFMSGYTADIISQHGILEDGIEFMQKPFTIQDLTGKVRSVLDS